MAPVAGQTPFPEGVTQSKLRLGVSGADIAHHPASCALVDDVWHQLAVIIALISPSGRSSKTVVEPRRFDHFVASRMSSSDLPGNSPRQPLAAGEYSPKSLSKMAWNM